MSELDLDAIEACANAATPGPWEHGGNDGLVWPERVGDPVSASTEPEDADFIAAARTDVPALVAEVRRLRAEREHMELNPTGAVDWLKNRVNELTAERDALKRGTKSLIEFRNVKVREAAELATRLKRVRAAAEKAEKNAGFIESRQLLDVLGEPHPAEGRPAFQSEVEP